MATTHTLLPMARRTATQDVAALPIAGRTRALFTVITARVTNTLQVALGASPDGVTWDTLTLLNITTPGVVSRSATAAPADFTIQPYHRYICATPLTVTDATFEAVLSLPFVDTTVTADAALFSKELRAFSDGFARLVDLAEDEVMSELLRSAKVARRAGLAPAELPLWSGSTFGTTDRYGRSLYDSNPDYTERLSSVPDELVTDASFDLPGFGDAVRSAIVQQAEHLHRRHKLQLANDPGSIKTLRDLPDLAPGLLRVLDKFRNVSSSVYRGR